MLWIFCVTAYYVHLYFFIVTQWYSFIDLGSYRFTKAGATLTMAVKEITKHDMNIFFLAIW